MINREDMLELTRRMTPSKTYFDNQPAEPVFGFLYPAFSDRSPDQNRIDIYHLNPDAPEEGLLYKITGRI